MNPEVVKHGPYWRKNPCRKCHAPIGEPCRVIETTRSYPFSPWPMRTQQWTHEERETETRYLPSRRADGLATLIIQGII